MYKHLTREQRYVIYPELQRKTTQEVIARLIGVSKSTVCREIKRNSTANGKYIWCKAQDMTEHRKGRTPGNRAISPILRRRVEQLINTRPSTSSRRQAPRHWEIDLIVDKDNHAILTLVERSTNFLLMEKLQQGKKAKPLAKVVWRLLLPQQRQNA